MSALSNFKNSIEARLQHQERSVLSSLKSMSERDCSFHAGYIAACNQIIQDIEEILKDVKSW